MQGAVLHQNGGNGALALVQTGLLSLIHIFKGLTPEQFVLGIVRDCNARALVCGEHFTFGAKAAGNPELLRTLCAPLGVEVIVVPMAQFEEKPDVYKRQVRDGIVITEDEIASLKRFKDDAKEVAEGNECGVTLAKFADVKEGDVYEAFKMEEYRD